MAFDALGLRAAECRCEVTISECRFLESRELVSRRIFMGSQGSS